MKVICVLQFLEMYESDPRSNKPYLCSSGNKNVEICGDGKGKLRMS